MRPSELIYPHGSSRNRFLNPNVFFLRRKARIMSDAIEDFIIESESEWRAFVNGLLKRAVSELEPDAQEAVMAAVAAREATFTTEPQPDGTRLHRLGVSRLGFSVEFSTIAPGAVPSIPGYL